MKNTPAVNTLKDPTAKLRSMLSPAQLAANRIDEILGSKYFPSAAYEDFAFQFDEMIRACGQLKNLNLPHGGTNRPEPTAVALIGDSGAGKTTALGHYLDSNPFFEGHGIENSDCQLIRVSAPSPLTLRTLGMAVLRAMYKTKREFPESEAWPRALFQLEERMVLFIVIEDVQRVLHQSNEDEVQKLIDTLVYVMANLKWPVYLVITATPEIKPFLEIDWQLRRRVKYVDFKPIDAVADFEDLTTAMASYGAEVKVSVAIAKDRQVLARLCHAANYQRGYVFKIFKVALAVCLKDKRRKLTINDFADAYSDHTTEPQLLNPFLEDDWQSINTKHVYIHPPQVPEDPEPPKKKKKRTRRTVNTDE